MTVTRTRWRRWEPYAVFGAAVVVFGVVGVELAAGQHLFSGDALSRVQTTRAVLFSRDPHLSALGFIFTPLTALMQLPLIAFSPWWPPLATDGLSAVVVSVLFMAGLVVQVLGIARDRDVPDWVAVAVTLCLALNPMIVYYAANGMSEAPYLFFLAWACRRLIRWVDTDDVHELVVAGIALALSYLTRYDGAIAAIAACGFVAFVTARRAPRAGRSIRAFMDAVVVGAPSAVAIVVWAVTSWLITGKAFAQFSSAYGNSAIIAQSGGTGADSLGAAMRFSVTEMAIMAPLFPLLFLIVAFVRWRRRRLLPLALPVIVIGSVLAFQIVSYAQGSTFGFLRFYITAVLIQAIVAILAVAGRGRVPARRPGLRASGFIPQPSRRVGSALLGVAGVVAMGVAVVSTTRGMQSPRYAPQEFALAAIVGPQRNSVDPIDQGARTVARSFSTERELANYLDAMHLPRGSVLCDTVFGFAVVAQSADPGQFVIPSDRDFTEILNDPAAAGIRYMLAVPPTGRGVSDALNVRFPTLYDNGAQIAVLTLEARNQGQNLPNWRVYRVAPGVPAPWTQTADATVAVK